MCAAFGAGIELVIWALDHLVIGDVVLSHHRKKPETP
jgi:hypothetical protein